MRSHLIVWTLVLGLAAGISLGVRAAPKAAKAVPAAAPKVATIKACQKTKPAVSFPHEKHVKGNKIACKTCHHKGDSKGCSAQGCHAGKAEGKRPGCSEMSMTKNPYHISCVGCHKKGGKGPKACGDCHKK